MKYKRKNPANLYNKGGALTQYEGFPHSQGGINIDAQNQVEDAETRGIPNTATQDYIFSEQLLIPGKKFSFAKESKRIENKYSKRANDKLSNEQKERELNSLMNSKEQVRSVMLDKTVQKAFGGDLSKAGQWFANYGRGMADATLGTFGATNVIQDEDYKGYGAQGINQAATMVGNVGKTALPMVANAFIPGSGTAIKGAQMVGSQFNPQDITKEPTQFDAQGNPINYENTYNPAKYAKGGRIKNMYQFGGATGEPELSPAMQLYNKEIQELYSQYGNTPQDTLDPDYVSGQGADMSKISPKTSYTNPQQEIQDINKQYGSQPSNFDLNTLYNVGNYIGPAVDIYNSLKGPANVNYERVTPNLVDYSKSRDLTRQDIKTGFRSTKDVLKNVNSPAQYLNLTMQAAGQRDKTTSDAIAKSVEAERNINANIKNQIAQFNAQTQRAEADARQMEIDQARNVGRTGVYNLGTAIASTGRDVQARISQDEAKRFIGSTDYSPIKDKTGKITGYRHKGSNKIYIIE